MGEDDRCSWDDDKRLRNLATHDLDFVDLAEGFDGRFCVTRQDVRRDYGEQRFNMLVEFVGRVVNVTFTRRSGKYRLISARLANRAERSVYRDRTT